MAIADIDKPGPKIKVAEIGAWGIVLIGATASAVAALTGQLPAWSTQLLHDWRTGLLAVAGFAFVLVGQIFFTQYFELRRAKVGLLAEIDEQQARADELIEILENEALETAKPLSRARSRSSKLPRPTRIIVSGD
jgi:hypothetical protein